MRLTAATQQIPAPGARTDVDMPRSEITAEGDDYDTAVGRLRDQLPDGWRMLFIRRD